MILVTSHDSRVFKKACDLVKEAHMIGNLKKLEIVQYKLERITTLCSALRDLAESHIELRNDFILL